MVFTLDVTIFYNAGVQQTALCYGWLQVRRHFLLTEKSFTK